MLTFGSNVVMSNLKCTSFLFKFYGKELLSNKWTPIKTLCLSAATSFVFRLVLNKYKHSSDLNILQLASFIQYASSSCATGFVFIEFLFDIYFMRRVFLDGVL